MGFRKTLTFLILATALIVAPFAGARQRNVGPSSAGPRPNAVRPYVACAALMGGGAVAAVSDRRYKRPSGRRGDPYKVLP